LDFGAQLLMAAIHWLGQKREMPVGSLHLNAFFRYERGVLALIVVALLFSVRIGAQAADPSHAQTLEQEGKLAEAAKAWRDVVKSSPKDSAAWASLGLVLAKLQDYKEAGTAYRKAIALNPKLPGVQLNLGLTEFKSNNFQAAIEPLRVALEQDPQNLQARMLLGLSFYGAGQFAEAAKHLELASKANPSNAELHNVLAQSCLSAKKYDCALDEFSWILKRNPDSAAAHMLTGQALDGLGRTPEAIALAVRTCKFPSWRRA